MCVMSETQQQLLLDLLAENPPDFIRIVNEEGDSYSILDVKLITSKSMFGQSATVEIVINSVIDEKE